MTDDLDDSLIFADESEEDLGEAAGQAPWKLLVVDDDEGIHQVTKLALDGFSLDGRELDLLKATGLESARKVMADNPMPLRASIWNAAYTTAIKVTI